MEGTERPTANEIARRAGVSTSSFFRYFESIDDLRDQATNRYVEQHHDLLESSPPSEAGLEKRSRLFVDLRIRAAAALGPASRRLNGRAVSEPGLIPIQTRFHATLAGQVEAYFEPELSSTTRARRAELIALIDSMTSMEAFQIMHETHARTEQQVRRSWLSALDGILRPSSRPDAGPAARRESCA